MKKQYQQSAISTIVSLLLVFFLIACGSGSPSGSGGTNSDGDTATAITTATPAPAPTPTPEPTPPPATASEPTPTPTPEPTPTPDNYKESDLMEFGGYEWLVLEVSEGKALLLSEYVLEYRAYNEGGAGVTWETCTLRAYLNGEFYNSFSADDQARIAQARNSNKDNQWYGTLGGNDTDDYIFLLSLEEVTRYFGDSGQLANRPSKNGEYVWYIEDQYNEARTAYSAVDGLWGDPAGTASWWWLRSTGEPGPHSEDSEHSYLATTVALDGTIRVDGILNHGMGYNYVNGNYDYNIIGVRPALWVNLE
jgi:hypothetical protein